MRTVDVKTGLNEQQKKFCHYYAVNKNATRSAILAGYSEPTAAKTGSRLLRYANVQKYLTKLTKKAEEKAEAGTIASRTEILEFYTNMMRNEAIAPKSRIMAANSLGDYYSLANGDKASEVSQLDKIVQAIEDATKGA